ncbi:MAG TPA: uroporphyrinogen-III synthase, partial [Chitinophagaceae bacterium]|nr:uroporphyrinogen-III synthase [Chitinophagaceae bacterium]
MQKDKISILCTRAVNDSLRSYAESEGIEFHVESFIETEPVETIEVQQEIEQAGLLSATVVFTSMNAVEAVANVLDGQIPDWEIFCIGNTTKEFVEKYFGEESLKDTAEDASLLADTIVIEGETD